ncbi:MAG: molybdopterin molybdotransferase MoeA [Deferribacteraceae bacterium]|nr:molybdopterin molybdotransferase MoeA [Deferribacteraceae bacterium]
MSNTSDLYKAIETISKAAPRVKTEFVGINKLNGQVCAESVCSSIDYPVADRSLMDGIAYNRQCADPSKPLKIVKQLSAAETYQGRLNNNDCAQLSTGSFLPAGADTVIPIEDVKITRRNVHILRDVPAGKFIEKCGDIFHKGDLVLSKGAQIDPWYVETLAALRINSVKVLSMPRLGILSTGSEMTGQFSARGAVINSNYYALSFMLRKFNVPFGYLGIVNDDESILEDNLRAAVENFDAVITIGGTARGRYDLMHSVVSQNLKGKVIVNGVKVAPGKTFRFAKIGVTPLFILPGTPAAAIVCSELFITSWLLAYQGVSWKNATHSCTMGFEITKKAGFYKLIPCWCKISEGRLTALSRTRKETEDHRGARSAMLILEPDTTKLSLGDTATLFDAYSFF